MGRVTGKGEQVMTALRNQTLDDAISEARQTYAARRPKSEAAHEHAAKYMPGGNTRTVLFHGPFPLRIANGTGAHLTDADGHRYLNLLGEYTAGLFGHSHPVIRKAIDRALDGGVNFGGHNTFEPQLAELVCARFASIERVRFTNSGTEANLMAIATARHHTRRTKVMVMHGGYHGGLLYFGGGGIPINAPYPFVFGRYNDIDATRVTLREHAADLACVLVEPMMGSSGCIPADPAFLAMLREDVTRAGAVLIFDEVMTSRFGSGGAQSIVGIRPDMTTLGKWIGGGMSFGAFGGRTDIMQMYDPTRKEFMPHAGTFNNNVLTMSAGIAAMKEVFASPVALELHANGDRLRDRLNALFASHDVDLQMTGQGSLMSLHGTAQPIRRPDDTQQSNDSVKELIFLDLLEREIYLARRGFIALSLVITAAHIDGFASALEDILRHRRAVLPRRHAA
jgi:glutamate-1-semialdehyde 2,1-aminomutase